MPTILVADDNSNIQKMATLALRDHGIEVVAVGNGEAAVRKLADLRPDLILADIFMPVRSGYEVCEFVKNDKRLAHIPVILLVGAFDPLDEQEVRRVRADGVLKKPFVPPDPLIAMVTSTLEKSAKDRLASQSKPAVAASPAAASASAEISESAVVPEPEAAAEEFAVAPQRWEFREGEQPLAFSELLGAPAVELEPQPAQEESCFSNEPRELFETPSTVQAVWSETAEAAPTRETLEPELSTWGGIEPEPRQPASEEPPAPVEFSGTEPLELVTEEAPETPEVELASLPGLVAAPAKWLETQPESPEEPGVVFESGEALAAEDAFLVPAEPETPVRAEPEPPAESAASFADVLPLEPETPTETAAVSADVIPFPPMLESASTPPVVEPVEQPEPAWPVEANAPQPAAPEPPAEAVSFAVPQRASSELVDKVVEEVLARLQPQLLDAITLELVRPMVEALLQRELEKKTHLPE